MTEFKVRKAREFDRETCKFTDKVLGWEVYLPHQCETWDIARGWDDAVPTNDEAQRALRAFLDDGEAALEALKAEQEYGDD